MKPLRNLRRKRTAAILVAVLGCLLVSMSLVAIAVQMAIRERLESRTSLVIQQAEWLTEAGGLRGRMKLSQDAGYAGEIWEPSELGASYTAARVAIEIDSRPAKGRDGRYRLTVRTSLASTLTAHSPIQRTRHFLVTKQP